MVFIPKCRRKSLYETLRPHLCVVFCRLALQKESQILEGHLMPDHAHNADCDPAEVCGIAGGGLHQGQECNPSCTGVRGVPEKFGWAALQGS